MGGDGDKQLRLQVEALTAIVADLSRALAGASVVPPTSSATIRQVFEAYCEHRVGDRSISCIKDRLRHVVRLWPDLPADQFTPKKWAEHRRTRLTELRKGKPPAPGTLNLELARTKHMLTWAASEEQGFIRFNPLVAARKSKPKPPRRTWLSEDDLTRLLAFGPQAARPKAMLRAFVLVGADSGLRFNETRMLRRDFVRGGVAHIPNTKNGKRHVAGLTARAMEALEAIPLVLGSPHYFANADTGNVMGRTTIWRWFRAAAERAGLDNIAAEGELRLRPHDLRRSAATNAHNRGATLLEVQDMLNHSTPAITSQYVQRTEANASRIALLMQEGAERERVGPRRSSVNALINKKVHDEAK
jgi:integrase